jgi:hypothetical protein
MFGNREAHGCGIGQEAQNVGCAPQAITGMNRQAAKGK